MCIYTNESENNVTSSYKLNITTLLLGRCPKEGDLEMGLGSLPIFICSLETLQSPLSCGQLKYNKVYCFNPPPHLKLVFQDIISYIWCNNVLSS